MKFEYHAHTERCGHASGAMHEYIERALEVGFGEFGFSEHSPWMMQRTGQWQALRWEELPAYVADVQALQKRYDRDGGGGGGKATGDESGAFRVRLGMELDFVPTRLEAARRVTGQYPWDVLFGSVHHLGFWCLPGKEDAHNFDRYAIEDVCALYFEHLAMMIRERFCDVVSHLDFLKRFGNRPALGADGAPIAPGASMLRWVEPLIPEIKKAGMAIEINASGLDHPVGEQYPSWEIIGALAAAGVPMLISSDAHSPANVGRHRGEIVAGLRKLGVSELVRFERRRMVACELE